MNWLSKKISKNELMKTSIESTFLDRDIDFSSVKANRKKSWSVHPYNTVNDLNLITDAYAEIGFKVLEIAYVPHLNTLYAYAEREKKQGEKSNVSRRLDLRTV